MRQQSPVSLLKSWRLWTTFTNKTSRLSKLSLTSSLNSDNVMYENDGTVKLIDSGYSMLLHSIREKLDPKVGEENKRYFWIAPEYLLGDKFTDSRSDIWAVGCLVMELATGQPPFFEEAQKSVQNLRIIHSKKGNHCSTKSFQSFLKICIQRLWTLSSAV